MNSLMKAAVYDRYGSPEVLMVREVPMPRPQANEVLVRVRASTVSSGDWRARSLEMPGGFGPFGRLVFGIRKPRQPILGMEFSGEIAALGSRVARFAVGDAVFGFTGMAMGSHAEYRSIDADGLIAMKPPGLTYEEAAALSFGGMTVLGFYRRAGLKAGERIAINGASGSVGVAAIQLAKHVGAHVTAISSGRNLELSRRLGADEVVDYTTENFTTNGRRYDVILDAAGTAPFSRIENSLTPQGRFVPVLGTLQDLVMAPLVNARKRRTIVSGVTRPRMEDLLLLQALAETGAYRPVIDRCFTLDQIVEAHRYVDTRRKRGSVAVSMTPGCRAALPE